MQSATGVERWSGCPPGASVEPTDDFKDQVFKLERDKRQGDNNNWNFGYGNDNGKHS